MSDRALKPGDVVCVQGVIQSTDGEAAISPTYLSLGTNVPRPVFATSRTLWGEGGLDVNGLLVRVSAQVGADQGNGTYSLIDDNNRTIYVKTNGVAMPTEGANVTITAVAASSGGTPVLLLANKHDIQVVAE